jgi:hypothetical protein
MLSEEEKRERRNESQRRYEEKHKEKILAYKREYTKRPEVHAKRMEIQRRYFEKPEIREKRRLRYGPDQRGEWKKGLSEWRKAIYKAKDLINRQTGISWAEMPQEMVEAKAALLLAKRELRKRRKQQEIAQ